MNSGLRDVASLAWRLGQIRSGISSEKLLKSYATEWSTHVKEIPYSCIFIGRPICETDPVKSAEFHKILRPQRPARRPALPRLGVGIYQPQCPAAGLLSLQRKIEDGERRTTV